MTGPPTYPVARLMALYASAGQDASEYFTERCGIMIFDGGQDEEYAVNQAHRETVNYIRGKLEPSQEHQDFERLVAELGRKGCEKG